MGDFWNENGREPGKHCLVDLGGFNDIYLEGKIRQLRAVGVGRANFQLVGQERMVVRLPPTKTKNILSRFRAIKPTSEAPGYVWCTHVWTL